MADIFISYSRQDRQVAEQVKNLLEKLNLTVFFDVEGLDGGDSFPDVLDREVKAARAVVGIWSPHALTRPWVRTECLIGKDRGVLLPAAVERLDPLMDVPAAFYGVQYIDLSHFNGDAGHVEWARFLKSLARVLKREDLLAAVPAHVRPELSRSAKTKLRTAALGAIALGAALAAAFVGFLILTPRPTTEPSATVNQTTTPETVEPVVGASTTAVESPAAEIPTIVESTKPTSPALPRADRLIPEVGSLDFKSLDFDARESLNQLTKSYSLKDFEIAAQKDMRTRTLLAFALRYGKLGAAKDTERANQLFSEACKSEEPLACLTLSTDYDFKWDGELDKDAHGWALVHAQTACYEDFALGCFWAGRYEERSYNNASALRFYERSCEGGHLWGCVHGGRISYEDFNNGAKGKALLSKACESGHVDGCFELVDFYLNGPEEWQDTVAAESLLEGICKTNDQDNSAHACRVLNDVKRNSEYQHRKSN